MKITAHSLVKNEERYLWYSLMSVIEYVDEFLIWDTGSTDQTREIIKTVKRLFPSKVRTKFIDNIDAESYTKARQSMLDESHGDWILIVDGDEVWWNDSISMLRETINKRGRVYDSIVSRYYNTIGDIYHYQYENIGKYKIDGKVGNLTIRAMNTKIPGFHTAKPHGQHGYFDADGTLVQERDPQKRLHLPNYGFLHFTHLVRSNTIHADREVVKRSFKYKYEVGESFPLDFYYPEVFFRSKPDIVPNVWNTMNQSYKIRAEIESLPRGIKRKLVKGGSGY